MGLRIVAYFLLLKCIFIKGQGRSLKYFSTFQFKEAVWGEEHLITDYVTLANGPEEDLPDSFTVCSSALVKFWMADSSVIEMFKEDGTHWFVLHFAGVRDHTDLSEKMGLMYENPITGSNEFEEITDAIIPIVPHSWYHICMGLDTVSGLFRIVVNGKEVVNKEKEYFKNTQSWKPKSVDGKILQFKGYWGGMWFQYRNTFSNMNIFSSMMSVEDMVSRTSGGEDCDSPGDYFR